MNTNRNPNRKEKAMRRAICIMVATLVAILTLSVDVKVDFGNSNPTISVSVGISTAHAYDIKSNSNYQLMQSTTSASKLNEYFAGCIQACNNSVVDKTTAEGLKELKGCKAQCSGLFAKMSKKLGSGGSTPPPQPVHHGGGGGSWCPNYQKYMPAGTTDCKCPDGTDETKLPKSWRKGCKARWIKDKDCFVVKDGEQCPCPDSTPLLNKETWVCEKCPADKPVWDKEKQECKTCFDTDSTKPFWDRCDGTCKECPEATPYWDGTTCAQCQEPSPVWNEKTGKCDPCPADLPHWQLPRAEGMCVKCDADYQWQPALHKCLPTKTVKCDGSGVMVADKKDCPSFDPVSQKWGKAGTCPAGKVLVKTDDPSRPSRCECKWGGQCTVVPGGCLWWLWFLLGVLSTLVVLGIIHGVRRARNRRNRRDPPTNRPGSISG